MKKICLIVSILLLSLLMAFSVGAKCASGCVYSTSPFCDVCGEHIEGECTGSHMFESGYCVICGASDNSMDDWCEVNQGRHNVLYGECTHCGKVFCYHTDMSELHVVTKATCKDTGYGYRLCLDCGAEYGESIPQKEHDYKNGVCIACGASNCSHDLFSVWSYTDEPLSCGLTCEQFRRCLRCLNYFEYRTVLSDHVYKNAFCVYCGEMDSDHVHSAFRVVILNEREHMYVCSCGDGYSASEPHRFEEQSCVFNSANYLPITKTLVCSDCDYKRTQCSVNPDLKVRTLVNGERVSYTALTSYESLYYEYTSSNDGKCEISVVNGAGTVTNKITLPELSKGEKLLVDSKTGFYSIWSDEVSKTEIRVDSARVTDMSGIYYQFKPLVDSVPMDLDRDNAYYFSATPDVYNYPDIDSSKDGTGFDRDYPMIGRGSGVNIMLISFPQKTLSQIKEDLDTYPLYIVFYDGVSVEFRSVTSTSDFFVATYANMIASNTGSSNVGGFDQGGSYAQGYADAYNTLTNAVIEKAPFQGFVQGMWYGVLSMVTILGNGISIGGISLFSILVSALVILVVYFVLKILIK